MATWSLEPRVAIRKNETRSPPDWLVDLRLDHLRGRLQHLKEKAVLRNSSIPIKTGQPPPMADFFAEAGGAWGPGEGGEEDK